MLTYPPKEADSDTVTPTPLLHHKPAKPEAHPAVPSYSSHVDYRHEPYARSFKATVHGPDVPYHFDASKPIDIAMMEKTLQPRFLPVNKHELSSTNPSVSETVSVAGMAGAPYAYNYRDRQSLELPSPSSSTSSQASKTPANFVSSSSSYSPSPFGPLLSNTTFESAVRCTLPSPTIFPPTPPPSAWNPFW